MRGAVRMAMAGLMVLTVLEGCSSSAPVLPADTPGQIAVYKLNAGDKLRIAVFNEPSLTGEFSVTGDGELSFPLIGNMSVMGKSIAETQAMLTSRLGAGYVKDPKVTIEVLSYRPYYMLGEVGRPGEFPFSVGLTVTQAIAVAGGFSYRANQRTVFIKRANDPIERKIDIRQHTLYVMPGDVIRVGERYF